MSEPKHDGAGPVKRAPPRRRRSVASCATGRPGLRLALAVAFMLQLGSSSLLAQAPSAVAPVAPIEAEAGAPPVIAAEPDPDEGELEPNLPGAVDPATLPRDFTLIGMFLNADIVVRAVMVGLMLASLAVWTVFLAKAVQLVSARRAARLVREELRAADSLAEAGRSRHADGAAAHLVEEATLEIYVSSGLPATGVKERVASRLERAEMAAGRRMAAGTGVLATIGAIAPFVGLFGTVWGIMNSFIGISRAQTTNLAIVAPGVAEALLATGIGLVAAIPAVVFYNVLSRWIGAYRAELADSSAEILRLVSRDLDRSGYHYAAAAQ